MERAPILALEHVSNGYSKFYVFIYLRSSGCKYLLPSNLSFIGQNNTFLITPRCEKGVPQNVLF